MKLVAISILAGLGPVSMLAIAENDAVVAVVTAVLGGGGILGIVKLWISTTSKREERADERLERVITAAQQEREKDRSAERAERERSAERFDATLQRFEAASSAQTQATVNAMSSLTDELRKLRADQRAGMACRLADLPKVEVDEWIQARPNAKPNGTRGG